MKKINHYFEVTVLACALTLIMEDSIAQAPPGYPVVPEPAYNYPAGAQLVAPGPPPPLQQEVIIAAPSPAHVWIPGYWSWQNRWIWIPGLWAIPPRPGAQWIGHRWVMHEDGNRYRMQHGEWR
ncbi:MAG: hypothetical protein ABSB19_09775 [Methylomonas sp.]